MKYLLMIYGEESTAPAPDDAAGRTMMAEYATYTEQLQRSGSMVGGEALHPTATATTVRVRNGDVATVDGPFAETKEQIGGYYLVDCPNLDEAIGWAAKIPGATTGSIEIRPIVAFSTNGA